MRKNDRSSSGHFWKKCCRNIEGNVAIKKGFARNKQGIHKKVQPKNKNNGKPFKKLKRNIENIKTEVTLPTYIFNECNLEEETDSVEIILISINL